MPKFLLDANLSHETAEFLEKSGHDAKTVAHFGLSGADDQKIVDFAAKKKLIIITSDSDFGQIYYYSTHVNLGIIVLKLDNQTIESVNKNLGRLVKTRILDKRRIQRSLIIVDERRIRIKNKSF